MFFPSRKYELAAARGMRVFLRISIPVTIKVRIARFAGILKNTGPKEVIRGEHHQD
jgi:hypothetical protein